MMKKKIYISGCAGMLGEAFFKEFSVEYCLKCTDIDVNEKWLSFCDIRNLEQYQNDVLEFNPDYLFHLGALTDLEYCETHPDEAYLTNALSVANACYIANKLKIPLLYISTAGIFDGNKTSYNDMDKPSPINHYGRSKYLGEVLVKDGADRYLICRAGWMMGAGPKKDKKFVNKIIQQIKNGAKELFIVNDKFGTPTYTHDFAKNVKLLLEKEAWGLYNLVCHGETSRLEVTQEILRLFSLTDKVKIKEVPSDFFKKEYFVSRPASERLINKKLESAGQNIMQNWKDALKLYLNSYYKDYL